MLISNIFLRFYLFICQRERESVRAQAGGAAGLLLSREPDVGLDPRTLGSRPKPKADA